MNLVVGGTILVVASFHREPVSREGLDAQDPYAPVMAKWWAQSGAHPVDAIVRFGIPYPQAFGLSGVQADNALVVVREQPLDPNAGTGLFVKCA